MREHPPTQHGLVHRSVQVARLVVALAFFVPAAAHAQNPPEAIEDYATDAVGSIRVVFDPTGAVVGRSDYLPFGETYAQTGVNPRQRFTG